MGCLGTFVISLIGLSITLYIVSLFTQWWSVLIVAAAVIAAGITAYMDLAERLERIEQQLGIHPKQPPSEAPEETKPEEENAP